MANVFSTATLGLRLDTSTFNNAIKASGLTVQQAFASMSSAADQFEAKWNDATAGIKDTRRIISGILISQGFYGIMNGFTEGASAALTFSSNMETAAISTEYFVTGADKAAKSLAYLREMSEFAARTPFSTEAANELSKYIQSVGIGMNVSKSVLRVITDAAAATGATEETMQRIVFALGQMKTKGRIAGEEIRQLANANVPIYEILQEELGLTGDEIANIGKKWVSADKAIVAILDGLEKRYSGAADRIAETMSGMVDTIVDDALIIAYQAGDGIYGTFEDIVRNVRDKLDEYRETATEFGAMGLFNNILLEIDPTGQFGTQLLTLVGDARQLIAALADLLHTSQPLVNLFGNSLYGAIGTVTVGATSLVRMVDNLERLLSKLGITSGQTGRLIGELFVMYQAGKWAFTLGQGALYAGQSLFNLGKSVITSLVPSMAMGSQSVLGMVRSLLVLAGAGVAVYSILNSLGGFAGLDIDTGSILPSDYQSEFDRYMAEMKEYNDEIAKYQEQFNEPYSAIGEGTDKAIESYDDLKKASKAAAKSVQHDWVAAFDEVYQVPTWNDPAGSGGKAAELPKLPDLGKLIGEIKFSFPGIPGDELKKPEFNWDEVFNNSFFDSDVFNGGWWKTMLPGVLAVGLATFFTPKGPKGPGDIPSGGDGKYVFDDAAIKKATLEFSDEIKRLELAIGDARKMLANGNIALPGTTPAYGVDGKTLLALADRLEHSTLALDKATQKAIEAGADPRTLPEYLDRRNYIAETEGTKKQLSEINREIRMIRGDIEDSSSRGEAIPAKTQRRLERAEVEKRDLESKLAKRAEMPDGMLAASRQQAKVFVDQLRAIGYEQRIKELTASLDDIGKLTIGQRELVIKELEDSKKALEKLVKDNNGINPKYNALSPVQFIDVFKQMGEDLAATMQTFVDRKYNPAVAASADTFNKDAILALQEQVSDFKLVGSYIMDNFPDVLAATNVANSTATRIYTAIMQQSDGIKKLFGQIARGSYGSKKGDESPITLLKDLAKQVTGLTDAAIEADKLLALQNAAAARARAEEAAAREADRINKAKALVEDRKNRLDEVASLKGRTLDTTLQAAAAEQIAASIAIPAPESYVRELRPLIDRVIYAIENDGIISKDPASTDGTGRILKLPDKVEDLLEQLDDTLLKYAPGEVILPKSLYEGLEQIRTELKSGQHWMAKTIGSRYMLPDAPGARVTVENLDIRGILHRAIRDSLGYGLPELLGKTPELLRYRSTLKGNYIGINDIAGMLQGSSAFGTSADVIKRLASYRLPVEMPLTGMRDASLATTIAGEITQQISDIVKYIASATLSEGGMTIRNGGLMTSNRALLQVDAIAEGVVKGVSRTLPVQIIGVTERVANQIAGLASAPSAGIASIDAAKLAAANSEAYYETGALVKAFQKAAENGGLTTGIVATINRDFDIAGTRFQKAFVDRLGTTPKSFKPLSTDAVMTWSRVRRARGFEDLSPKELVADYVRNVLMPTFGFFTDAIDNNLTGTEAARLAEDFKDVNKVTQQLRGSFDMLKDATHLYYADFTDKQLNALDISDVTGGVVRHMQLLEESFNTLGDTAELRRLTNSYAIMNANAGRLANAVLEVDLSAPIRQYTYLHQNANKWAADLLKADVKFSSGKAIAVDFMSTVDGIMLDYFNALDTTTADELGALVANTKARLLDVAKNVNSYFDLGADADLAKGALTSLAGNLEHIDSLSMTIRSYVDVLADINRAIAADLPIDKQLAARFDGLTRNVSGLISRFGLEADAWAQAYVRSLSNLNDRLRAAADGLKEGEYGESLSTIFKAPVEALLRIADSAESADLSINFAKSITAGALDDALKASVTGALTGVVPIPAHQASTATKLTNNATIIDLETFGLPQATSGGTVYPEIFSGAMYDPSIREMDRFYVLPDDIIDLIKEQGTDSAAVRTAVENYTAGIRAINDDFRKIYGQAGITEDVIAKGISKADAAKKLVSWTTSNPHGFTGYNATNLGRVGGAFDTNTIRAFTGVDVAGSASEDVMSMVTGVLRRYTGKDTTLKLTDLREMFGITDTVLQRTYGISEAASHTAQADVLVTNEVLKRIIDGSLDSIAAESAAAGWQGTTAAGEAYKGIKETLINTGKAKFGPSGGFTQPYEIAEYYFEQARALGVSEDKIKQLNDAYGAFLAEAYRTPGYAFTQYDIGNGMSFSNPWADFIKTSDFEDVVATARNTRSIFMDAGMTAEEATKAAAEATKAYRETATAAELSDIAGTIGRARQASIEDVGGPSLGNWLRSKFSGVAERVDNADIGGWFRSHFADLWDTITGRKTLDDYFDPVKAAGDTYEARVFNQHLFGGRRKSAPTFDDVRLAFEDLRAADTSPSALYNGMTMQDIRRNKNAADAAVHTGNASGDTAWVKEARELYERALKESYGDVADKFYKTVVNHVAGQTKNTNLFSSLDETLNSLDNETKVFALRFGDSFEVIGKDLEITAGQLKMASKQLKFDALIDSFEKLAKAGKFGDALKDANKLAQAVDLFKQTLKIKPNDVTALASTAQAFKQLTGDVKAFDTVMEAIDVVNGIKTFDQVSDATKTFIDGLASFDSDIVVLRSTAAGLDDAADTLLFAGRKATEVINGAADTLSNSFKSLAARAVNGIANFGAIDIAIAAVTAGIQHAVDNANKDVLQSTMLAYDTTGSVSTLAKNGLSIGNIIGDEIYHGAAQEFGNAIASGVVSSLGATAGFALGGKVGDAIGAAIGTAVAGPLGTIVGKVIGTGIGMAVGALAGKIADTAIDSMGGHSATNLYLDDYLMALRDGSLLTSDALDQMCDAVGVTAEEIEQLGQSAALAKHGVDVDAIEELARNINTNTVMGNANYGHYMEKDNINSVLVGRNDRGNYTPEEIKARLLALYGGVNGGLFRTGTVTQYDGGGGAYTTTATIIDTDDAAAISKTLAELSSYLGKDLSIKEIKQQDSYGLTETVRVVTDDKGNLVNYSFDNLDILQEAVRLTYTQGNHISDIANILSETINSDKELRDIIATSLGEGNKAAGYSILTAYDMKSGYLDLFNQAAGTKYTLEDISNNWQLGEQIQRWASQYNEQGVDELLRRLETSLNDVSLYNARPQYEQNAVFERPYGYREEFTPVAGSILNEGKQTLWGADLSSLLPEYLEDLNKYGFNLEAGSVMGQTTLSDPQAYNFATLSTDPELIKEALTGWRIDMSNLDLNGLDFSNLSITAKDAEILASAGIQINSDGTITFMKAEQASVTGAERSNADLDPSVFSQYVLDTLKGASLEINFEAGELKFDPKEIGSNMYGAMFKLPDDWKKIAEPEIQAALSQLGNVMDSGYVMITDKSVLNGEQTIKGFVRGLVGDNKVNEQVSEALGGIDALIHQEGQSVVDNITEWADAITIPSPFTPEELNEDMKAMFETMGIHFVEYGDEFLMQINQTGEHIKDGCVMLDADYWNDLPASLRGALEEMGVEVTEVGNQVMVDLSATMEAGIGNLVSLYTERPDLWDQLPEGIKTALQACILETDNGMLELINSIDGKLVQVGDAWVTSWESISDQSLEVIGRNNLGVETKLSELKTALDTGLVEISRVITEKDLPTLADDEIAVPFNELPEDIKKSLTGPGGLSSAMTNGLVAVKNVEKEQLQEIVGNAQTAASDVGTAGADIVTQIHDAVVQAGIELQTLETLRKNAGTTGAFLWKSNNTQGAVEHGYIDGKAVTYVAEYDAKGNFLYYNYVYDGTTNGGTTKTKPSTASAPGAGRGKYNKRASGGPASGLTLTGELGTEMAILPDGTVTMLGANGRGELVDLPAGTRVLNAEDTEEILKYTGPISNVPKLAEGNTDLVIQQPEQQEDQTFKALMMAFMKAMIGQETTNDAETDLAVTTDPMITVVDDATKQLKEGNEVAIHGAVATIQETMSLYNGQQLTTIDNGFNNVIAAISDKNTEWLSMFKLFEENLSQQLTTINNTIGDGFAQMSTDHTNMAKDIIAAIENARDEIVKAIKSISIGASASSSSSGGGLGGAGATGLGGTGTSGFGGGGTTFVWDGTNVHEVGTWRANNYVMNSAGEVDWSATAVALAAMGDWAGAVEAMDKRVEKVAALGTDYGVSNEDVYNKALQAYNDRIVGFSDYTANVRGYLSVGNVQNALDEFDKRGYKISVTGNDGGLSQEELWNQSLRGATGISFMQWMSLHQPGTYSAYPNYDPSEVLDVFDSDAPVITDAMDKNLKETAQSILNGENIQMDNFMDFCDLMARAGYANVDKNALEQIQAGHEDTVAITDAIGLLKDAFSNRISGVNGTLEYLAEVGMQDVYDVNGWNYKTHEGDMYGGGWSGSGLVVDLAKDYHAAMNAAAAAGDWAAFDDAAAKRDAKINYQGTGNNVSSTSSIAKDLENKYKRNGSARGSLINEEGLYYAGEEGKQEAIIPLEQPEVLDKLGNAIGPYVDGNNVFDYTGVIDDASVVIKEGNEVAIHGAVAALLEGQGSSNQTLIDQSITNKDEILTAIKANTDAIVAAIGSLATKISSMQSAAASAAKAPTAQQSSGGYSGGGGSTGRPTSYTPSISTPSANQYYNSNTDYHALMNQYAAAGNWSAFDDAASKRDLKMANDSSLNKYETTSNLREQLENLYKRHGSANGSIISEEGLYYAGEKDKQEAIIPLEQPDALAKVGQAISEYTDFQQAYIDYTGDIKDASKVVKEGNEVAIHGAVAALLEGWTNGNDELITLLTSHKDEIIAAINGVGTTITGSLNSMITSLKSSMSSGGSGGAAAQQQMSSGSYGGGGSTGRPTSYTPSVTTPSKQNQFFNSNTDYHALMNQYAAAGNWSAFDDAAAKRDLKMAADSSLNKYETTSNLREQLENLYKRNGSANGSIISEEGLYYAGEKNKQEAIIPLENPQALDKVGQAISEYTDFQQAYIDYTGDIDTASKVIKEGNEVAIHGAVAALLEGLTGNNDTLITLITSSKDEIIAAINGAATTLTGSLSGLISSMKAMASSGGGGSGASAQTSSGGYSGGGGGYSRPTSYTPSVTTPSKQNQYYNSNTDYHALMNAAAAAGDWSAFDDAAAKRDLKMAADPSLSKYRETDDVRAELEKTYKRNGSAMGSLIGAPGLYYAGEEFKQEAIIPLEQPSVLSKVGASIASFMPVDLQQQMGMAHGLENGGIGNTATYAPQPAIDPSFMAQSMVQGVLESVLPQLENSRMDNESEDKRPLYVGTLIADERGLKQLERKLYDIRQVEAGRR